MKQSLTYYITILVIKLKGIKKNFSKSPIDFKKIRQEDIHSPKGKFFTKNHLNRFNIQDTLINEIGTNKNSNKLLIFIPGGAFISGPAQHHWDAVREIATKTNHIIWICDYPKSPENQITTISHNIDTIYSTALEKYAPANISIIGDSVGGTLVAALIQRLILKNIKLPSKIILVSPVMDASMTNPEIDKLEKIDPMLSKAGVLSAKKMCAGDMDLKDKMISPLYGSFENFPQTIFFLAQNDIMYPDEKLAVDKLIKANVNIEVIEGANMPHIWPFLPVMKEAKDALKIIIDKIKT